MMSSSTHNTPHPIRERGHPPVHYVLLSMHRGAQLIFTCPSLENKSRMTAISLQNIASQSIGQSKKICIEDLRYPSQFLQIASKEPGSLRSSLASGSKYFVFHPTLNNPDYTIYSKRKKASLTCWISVRYLAVLSDILGSLVLTRLEFDLLRHGASCEFDPASPMFNYHEQLAHYCSTSSSLRLSLVAVRRECCS
jgi:hypothetical protein